MLVLSLVAWLLIGIAAAYVGKAVSGDNLGWLGLGFFATGGAIAGGLVATAISGAYAVSIFGAVAGALLGVLLRGSAEEIRTRGPGFAM